MIAVAGMAHCCILFAKRSTGGQKTTPTKSASELFRLTFAFGPLYWRFYTFKRALVITETDLEARRKLDILDEIDAILVNVDEADVYGGYALLPDNYAAHNAPTFFISNYYRLLKDLVVDMNEAITLYASIHFACPWLQSRYGQSVLFGVAVGTWFSHAITCGCQHYKAHCDHVRSSEWINDSHLARIQYEIGNKVALGTDTCRFLVDTLWFSVIA